MHSLKVQYIRIGTVQAGRLMRTVQIKNQGIFGTHGSCTVIEICHQLGITVHKVNLESFYTHFREITAYILHVAFESIISCPQNNAHVTGCRIVYQFFQVYFLHNLHQISLQVHSPSFIQNHIFNAIQRSKINISLVGCIVYSGLEVYATEVPVIPPFPGYFSRFDPGCI